MSALPRKESKTFRLFLNNIFLLSTDERQQLVLLGFGYFVFIERLYQMLGGSIPISLSDPQTRVRGLHIAARINAGSARSSAKLIEDVLAQTLL